MFRILQEEHFPIDTIIVGVKEIVKHQFRNNEHLQFLTKQLFNVAKLESDKGNENYFKPTTV